MAPTGRIAATPPCPMHFAGTARAVWGRLRAMSKDRDTAFFGHPAGLSTLFFTEMWERFSYYGMRACLIFYMTRSVAVGAMGMPDAKAGLVLGVYTSSVYLLSLPGGWIADRFLGKRKAV